jgi:hypothetical protein
MNASCGNLHAPFIQVQKADSYTVSDRFRWAIRMGILYPHAYPGTKFANFHVDSSAYGIPPTPLSVPDLNALRWTARPCRLKALFIVFLHRFEIDLMDGLTSAQLHREVNLFIEEDCRYEMLLGRIEIVSPTTSGGLPASEDDGAQPDCRLTSQSRFAGTLARHTRIRGSQLRKNSSLANSILGSFAKLPFHFLLFCKV